MSRMREIKRQTCHRMSRAYLVSMTGTLDRAASNRVNGSYRLGEWDYEDPSQMADMIPARTQLMSAPLDFVHRLDDKDSTMR